MRRFAGLKLEFDQNPRVELQVRIMEIKSTSKTSPGSGGALKCDSWTGGGVERPTRCRLRGGHVVRGVCGSTESGTGTGISNGVGG